MFDMDLNCGQWDFYTDFYTTLIGQRPNSSKHITNTRSEMGDMN